MTALDRMVLTALRILGTGTAGAVRANLPETPPPRATTLALERMVAGGLVRRWGGVRYALSRDGEKLLREERRKAAARAEQ